MGIYERMFDLQDGKIPVDPFSALLSEQSRGRLTSQQVADAILRISGWPVSQAETAEINALIATITGNVQQKLARTAEINDALRISEFRVTGYSTPAELKARLGV